jgi:hypothetical protein
MDLSAWAKGQESTHEEPDEDDFGDEPDEDLDDAGNAETDLNDLREAVLDAAPVVLQAADMLDPEILLGTEPDELSEADLEAIFAAVELLPPPVVRALQAHPAITEAAMKAFVGALDDGALQAEDRPVLGAFLRAAGRVAEQVRNVEAAPAPASDEPPVT